MNTSIRPSVGMTVAAAPIATPIAVPTPARTAGATASYQQKEATEAFVAELLRAVEKEWLQSMRLPSEVSWAAEGVMARELAKALAPSLAPKLFPSPDK